MKKITHPFYIGLLFLCSAFITVAQPVASFVINYPSPVCNPAVISFTNISFGDGPLSYTWSFGINEATDTLANPTFIYDTCGIFSIVLIVTDTFGQSASDTQQVVIHCSPQADFIFTPAIVCDSANVLFTDTSTPADSIISWQWNFGDPSSGALNFSSEKNPEHHYDSAGIFLVSVTVTTGAGCSASKSDTVSVDQPKSYFALSDSACVNDAAQFTDLSSSQDSIIDWFWNFADYDSDSNFSSDQNPTHIYVVAGIYDVRLTITTENGCKNSLKKAITVHALPNVNAGEDQSICPDDTVQLQASGANNYSWEPASFLSDASVSDPLAFPPGTLDFFLTGVDSNGCMAHDTITINVITIIANAGTDTTICAGTSFVLQGSGGTSFLWSPHNTLDNDTIANPTAIPLLTTTYHLTVKDSAGCTATDSVIVTVSPLPVANITSLNDHYCSNGVIVDLSATPPGGLFSGDGVSNNTFIPSAVPEGGPYYIIYNYSDSIGCFASDTDSLFVFAPPEVTLSTSDSSVCVNATAVSFSLSPEGGILFGPAISNNFFEPSLAGAGLHPVYYSVTDTAGCSATDTLSMTVFSLPAIDAGADTVICSGDTIQLQASGGINYTWSPDSSLSDGLVQNPFAFPITTTQYTVTAADTNQCTNSDSLLINVFNAVNVDAGADVSICKGDTIALMANGGTDYSWSPSEGLSDTTIANPLAFPQETKMYKVTVNAASNCPETDSVLVTVLQLPIVMASENQSLCKGDSVQLIVTGALTYLWEPFIGLNDNQIENPLAFPSITTTYVVTGTDSNSCSHKDSVMLTVLSLPIINAGSDTSLCSGDTLQLNASGGISYSWSPDSSLSNGLLADPFAYPLSTTQYTVTAADTNQCTNADSMLVTVLDPLNVDAGADVSICKGDTIALSATGGTDYSWSPSEGLSDTTIADALAFPQETKMYTVISNAGSNCPGMDSVLVTVLPLPIVIASENQSLCDGDSVQLYVSGALTYLWEPSTGLNDDQIENPLAFPQILTTYIVTGTNYNECSAKDSVVLTVLPLPLINAGTDTSLCSGDSLQLNASGGLSYVWMPVNSLSDDSIAAPLAFPDVTTNYIVTGTDGSGCSNNDSINIFVLSPDLIDAGPDTSICKGDSIQLNATGGLSFTWLPAAGLSDPLIANPLAFPDTTTVYSVTVSVGTECIFADSVQLTVKELPLVDAGTDSSVCPLDSVQLFATGATSYHWSPENSLSDPNIANPFAGPVTTTTYQVTGTDVSGCKNTDSVTIVLLSAPVANAGTDTAVCIGDSIVLQATGGTTFLWTPASSLSDAFISNPVAFPTTTTSYIVKVNDGGICFGYDTVIVVVNSLPVANAGEDQVACAGSFVQLNASGGMDYSWSPATGLSASTINNPIVTVTESITYTVTVTDQNHCIASDTVLLEVPPPLIATISDDTAICIGTSAQLTASGGESYTWFPGEALNDPLSENPIASPLETTIFSVIVTDGICYAETLQVIVFISLPTINAGSDASVISGETFQFNVTASSGIYFWTPSENLSCTDCLNPIATPLQTTTYTVSVTDSIGCMASDDISVFVGCNQEAVFIPNAFTPDKNGHNDVLYVRSTGVINVNYFRIFDRWGQMIFESNDINDGWDGTYKDQAMPPGVYLFTMQASCGNGEVIQKQGNVTLLK